MSCFSGNLGDKVDKRFVCYSLTHAVFNCSSDIIMCNGSINRVEDLCL